MRIKLVVLTILFFLFGAKPVSAAISFTISNPQITGDETTVDVSLSGLTSSSCANSSCYIQAAFTSPSPTRYFGFTKNNNGQWYEYISSPSTTYIQSTLFSFQPTGGAWSGQITLKINAESSNYKGPGIYNVKAWRYSGNSSSSSGDSNVLAVNIQSASPTPTTTPSSTPASSSTSSDSSNSPTSSFIISDTPSQINSDQSFTISVNLSLSDNPNTSFYLKGAFKKSDSSNYFGFTKVGSSWIKNSDTYTNQFKINTDSSGNWSGNLEVKPDSSDSGFTGTGDYSFKLGKYNSQEPSPSVSWSNETTIIITGNQTSSSTPAPTPKPSSTPTSSTSTKAATSFAAPSVSDTNTPQLPILGLSTSSAEASAEAYADFKQSKNAGIPMIIGGLIIIASSIGVYLRYKRTHVQS